MKDLTIIYYTAHQLWEPCAFNVRKYLLKTTGGRIPIICVSQKPIADFGKNICVGEIGRSYYNCYKQILTGVKATKTQYIACCEDDTLYPAEHFKHRPSSDSVVAYNRNMWFSEEKGYWRKKGDYGMCGCIVDREFLISILEPRFTMFPEEPGRGKWDQMNWQEPGRFDNKFGVKIPKVEFFETKYPMLTFNYFMGLGGKKGTRQVPEKATQLPFWGDGIKLWQKFWKGEV